MKKILLLTFAFISVQLLAQDKIKVSCVGNSVTYGMTIQNREVNCYPAQLQVLLGDKYDVRNFGKSGATLLRKGHRPYNEQVEYKQAIDFAGDLVIIHLGLNDTDPRNWPNYRDEFITDYLQLIKDLRAVNPKCKIWVCRMTPISHRHHRFKTGTRDWYWQIQEKIELISKIANVELIDLQELLYNRVELLPDALHPNAEGASILAKRVYSAITGDFGGLKMPITYSDNMVLQRNKKITISGIANAGERVTVKFNHRTQSTVTPSNGKWEIVLKPMKAAKNLKMEIYTKNKKFEYNSVAVGEVWLCSGQSNMTFRTDQIIKNEREELIKYAKSNPNIRLFNMSANWYTSNEEWRESALDSLNHLQYFSTKGWELCNENTAQSFSAIALAFGKKLSDSLDVTIGLIHNSVGGSPIEAWIDRKTLEFEFDDILYNWKNNTFIQEWVRGRAAKNIAKQTNPLQRHPYEPCYLFEAGIMPLNSYNINGVIWYQGESNAHNIEVHQELFNLFVSSWRNYFNEPDLPIYFVQLSSLNRPSWPMFRDSQRKLAASISNCEMAVSSDRGDSLDVHPTRKVDVANRLSSLALKYSYKKNIVANGPESVKAFKSGKQIIVSFNNANGLTTDNNKQPLTFELAGEDEQFYNATAKIVGTTVELTCPNVKSPLYVRYGWQPFTRANLINKEGFPASTFKINVTR